MSKEELLKLKDELLEFKADRKYSMINSSIWITTEALISQMGVPNNTFGHVVSFITTAACCYNLLSLTESEIGVISSRSKLKQGYKEFIKHK